MTRLTITNVAKIASGAIGLGLLLAGLLLEDPPSLLVEVGMWLLGFAAVVQVWQEWRVKKLS